MSNRTGKLIFNISKPIYSRLKKVFIQHPSQMPPLSQSRTPPPPPPPLEASQPQHPPRSNHVLMFAKQMAKLLIDIPKSTLTNNEKVVQVYFMKKLYSLSGK